MSENNDGKDAGLAGRGRMTSVQYEALCRHAIARIYGIPGDRIHGGHLLGVTNRRQKTRHQIDLYWDVSDGMLEYRVFANAKWRTDNVEVMDIMALIGVWRDIGAHKALLITNTGFDVGVKKQAEEKGIGLLIVRPTVEFEGLATRQVPVVVEQIEKIAAEKRSVFAMEVVHKGWEDRLGDKETGRQGEGNAADGNARGEGEMDGNGGGWVLMGGFEGGGGVEDKGMRGGEVSNKIMGRLWRKG